MLKNCIFSLICTYIRMHFIYMDERKSEEEKKIKNSKICDFFDVKENGFYIML